MTDQPLSKNAVFVLQALNKLGAARACDIKLDKRQVYDILDRLEKKQLIEKRCAATGNHSIFFLTDAGRIAATDGKAHATPYGTLVDFVRLLAAEAYPLSIRPCMLRECYKDVYGGTPLHHRTTLNGICKFLYKKGDLDKLADGYYIMKRK